MQAREEMSGEVVTVGPATSATYATELMACQVSAALPVVDGHGRYGAVVLGSAVYAGHRLDGARHWATAQAGALGRRPVWLFSSGPTGEPPFPPDEAYDVGPLATLTGARGHVLLPGRLDWSLLRDPAVVQVARP